ncbi:MAG: HPr family phosphocarrier protein [Lachnospiraceae bacterium]|nr:HPr family phosphocarrier protein [Lachnospiraceae bacterium]
MVSKRVIVRSEQGLHLRPAGELCRRAVEFESTHISIRFRDREFNAKSVLGVLSACVRRDDEIEIICEGPQEKEALQSLTEMF